MNWYESIKPALKGIKWGVIAAVLLSGWIMAAWIKADLKPSFSQLGQKVPPMILEPLKPSSGQQWLFKECVPVQYLEEKGPSGRTSHTPSRRGLSSGVPKSVGSIETPERLIRSEAGSNGQVLPLGKFLVPASGRDPLFATPLLDSQTGKTTLRVEPAGGFARFGGERYAYLDLQYERAFNLPQEALDAISVQSLNIGLHQDLGRVSRLELMAEGWIGATLSKTQFDQSWGAQIGAKLRVALSF